MVYWLDDKTQAKIVLDLREEEGRSQFHKNLNPSVPTPGDTIAILSKDPLVTGEEEEPPFLFIPPIPTMDRTYVPKERRTSCSISGDVHLIPFPILPEDPVSLKRG